MPSPPRAFPPNALALAGAVLLAGCDQSLVQPRGPTSRPTAGPNASVTGGPGCPRVTVPPPTGENNTGIYTVTNASCGSIMGYHEVGTNSGVYHHQQLYAGYTGSFGGRWCFVTVWNAYPTTGGTCFQGPPNDGQFRPAVGFIFTGPVSLKYDAGNYIPGGNPVRGTRKYYKLPYKLHKFPILQRSAVFGVRG